MPLNLIFIQPGNYTLEDDGIPGNNTSVIKDGNGVVIFTFVHPADALGFTVSTPGVNITVNFTDSLGTANFTIGNLAQPAESPESVVIKNVHTTGTVTLVANQSITEGGADFAADITAGAVVLSAGTGVGTAANAIETRTGLFEAETDTGGIAISNFGSVQIGAVSPDVDGLDVVTSGDINFSTVGSIFLTEANTVTATEVVHGGGASGNVILTASGVNSDIIGNVDNGAVTAPRGSVTLTAGRDIQLGTIGADFNNDVISNNTLTLVAGRDILIDGFADLLADNFGNNTGDDLIFTAGRNIGILNLAGTSASVTASGSAGGNAILTTGNGGTLTVNGPGSFALGSTSGNVIVTADRILIDAASGISAPSGVVTIRPRTEGRETILGSLTDAALAIELSDTELNRIFTPNLTIGSSTGGALSVIGPIAPAGVANLTLVTQDDMFLNGGIATSASIRLFAGNNLSHTIGALNTGTLIAEVDNAGDDAGTGGVGLLQGAVVATSVALSGNGDADVLRGAEGTDQFVHGNDGNDIITSSGEGRYFGDGGDDRIFAGLSSGLFPELLDGGTGTDTLDTSNFGGTYNINMVTGVTNFAFETFSNFENVITGDGSDTITGTAGNNIITTNGGADTLIGGAGADTLIGGTGDDMYNLDSVSDTVTEFVGEGNDRIFTSVSYTLAPGLSVETFTTANAAGTTAIALTGNALVQAIVGNAGANSLDSGGGGDTMTGLGGDDVYFVRATTDRTIEAAAGGTDSVFAAVNFTLEAGSAVETLRTIDQAATTAINLTGNALLQTILGNEGANTLDSGGGGDTMVGVGGDDFYFVRAGTDRAVEAAAGGTDRVFAAVSFALEVGSSIETLSTVNSAAATAINLTGNALTQAIVGNAGANTLDSGGGSDVMTGLVGDDFYFIRSGTERAVEGVDGGNDRVLAGVSFALEAGSSIELLMTVNSGATTAINLTGNALAQSIVGNAGANTLDSAGGGDVMIGLGGNDFYFVRAGADRASEAGGGGTDRVFAAVSFALEAGSEIEILSTDLNAGVSAINLTGNELGQSVIGNAGANVLDGRSGNDILTGLGGADTFAFTTALGAGNIDQVGDFQVGVDEISLENAIFTGLAGGALAASAFVVGAAAADASDRIIYNSATGALLFDVDGLGGSAAVQFATLSTGLALTAADFVVV